MSKNTSETPVQDKSGTLLILIGFAFMIGALAFYLTSDNKNPLTQSITPAIAAPINGEPTNVDIAAPIENGINVKAALAPRKLGSDDAPVKIHEFSSLTCGHCGHFHNTTFKTIKQQYVDTGKVQFIFSDFPLNEPALDATMIARCLPSDQYLPFVTSLFEDQEKWAYGTDYKNKLRSYAEKFGLDKISFNECLASQELRDGLVRALQANARQWQVNSTPSFLFNNKEMINGGKPANEFSKIIEKFLAE